MYRLLSAAALIAFLSLSGCGGSADPKTANAPTESIDVQLEGTWTSQVIIDEEEAAKADAAAVEVIKSMKMQMTFTEDGTLQIDGESNGQPYHDENSFELVEEPGQTDNVLKIRAVTRDGRAKDHEFFFNDSNSFDIPLNLETAKVGALRFTRMR